MLNKPCHSSVLTLVVFLLISLACSTIQASEFKNDFDAPIIFHTPRNHALPASSEHTISAKVLDNIEISKVFLRYRAIGEYYFKHIEMKPTLHADIYAITLSNDTASSPGLEYYIESIDTSGNIKQSATPYNPYTLNIEAATGIAAIAANKPAETTPKSGLAIEKKWIWIGIGVLAVGVLASAASSGSGGGSNDNDSLILNIPKP